MDDTALFTRVRSLVRLKAVTDELRQRALASREFGIGDPLALATAETGLDARILLIEDRPGSAERLAGALRQHHTVTVETDPQAALRRAAEEAFDLALVSLDLDGVRRAAPVQPAPVPGPDPRDAADHDRRGA